MDHASRLLQVEDAMFFSTVPTTPAADESRMQTMRPGLGQQWGNRARCEIQKQAS